MCIEGIKELVFRWETETRNYENKMRKFEIQIKHEIDKLNRYTAQSVIISKSIKKAVKCKMYLNKVISIIKEDTEHIDNITTEYKTGLMELDRDYDSTDLKYKISKRLNKIAEFEYQIEASKYRIKSITRSIKDLETYIQNNTQGGDK